MDSSTSAPWPGAERMTAEPPEPGHAGPYGLGDALTILRHGIGVEPVAPVADEEHHHVGLDLGVERDLGGAGPFGGVDGGFPGGIEQGAQPVGELAVPHHHHLHLDTVVGLHLTLQHADALGHRRGIVTEGARRAALEEPRPQLALLAAGQARHVLGVIGRTLDESERLQHRVVHVGRHLRPLLGQGPGLAFRHQVAHQADPPGPEDHHDGGDDQYRSADRAQGRTGGVAEGEHEHAAHAEQDAHADAQDEGPARVVFPARTQHGHDVVVDPQPLLLADVAPDQDRRTTGQEHGPDE